MAFEKFSLMKKDSDFSNYLLAEYNNIAQAHFNTINTISSFFRYYIMIMALPITLFSAFASILSVENIQNIYLPKMLLAIFSLIIAIAGFFVFLYITNLRADAILYARTVNAIRKHFYDASNIDIDTQLRTRILPQSAFRPSYFETWYFFPVVFSFTLLNSLYFSLSIVLGSGSLIDIVNLESWERLSTLILDSVFSFPKAQVLHVILPLIFFISHFFGYWLYARHREHAYLKSNSIGIDIDGVLNRHRHHFCKFLEKATKKKVNPENITVIPVHEDETLNISRDDEKLVFNNPRYWIEMPSMNDAADIIKRLQNAFKLEIFIFTHRPWPSDDAKNMSKEWKDAASKILSENPFPPPKKLCWLPGSREGYYIINKIRMKLKVWKVELRPIDIITKSWLYQNNVVYDKLIIEKTSEDVYQPRTQFHNRFYISREKKIRYFVEDDYRKAKKLAYICDIVFLIEHPYNKNELMPNNVIRVKSWNEIYKHIRNLS